MHLYEDVACSKTLLELEQLAALMMSSTVIPDIAAVVVAASLVECAWNLELSTPAFCSHDFICLMIVLEVIILYLPINDRKR